MKKWTVYCTTNLVNGRRYIGVHKTADPEDDYLGSGKLIRYAVQKHGRENFRKEVLLVTEEKEEAFALEASLVTKDALESGDLYNLKEGGEGGWDHITPEQSRPGKIAGGKAAVKILHERWQRSESRRQERSLSAKKRRARELSLGIDHLSWKGKRLSEDTKRKLSASKRVTSAGQRNSQFGTMWITDGVNSRKVKKIDGIPEGWRQGRKFPPSTSGSARDC